MTTESRAIYSGPIRRALESLERKVAEGGGTDAAQGLLLHRTKAVGQTFNDTMTYETLLTSFTGVVVNPVANRHTKIHYGIQIHIGSPATGNSYFYLTLRAGNTVGGTTIERHIVPWYPGQQSYDLYGPSFVGSFSPIVVGAGGLVSLTWMLGGFGPSSMEVGTYSYMDMVDLGAV